MVICPECDTELLLDDETDEGYIFTCEECDSKLQVYAIDPFEIRVYDPETADYDEYDDSYNDDREDELYKDEDEEDYDYDYDYDYDDNYGRY